MSGYVIIPELDFDAFMFTRGFNHEVVEGVNEKVYSKNVNGFKLSVFSTIENGETRPKGEDAIRLTLYSDEIESPIGKTKKTLRTGNTIQDVFNRLDKKIVLLTNLSKVYRRILPDKPLDIQTMSEVSRGILMLISAKERPEDKTVTQLTFRTNMTHTSDSVRKIMFILKTRDPQKLVHDDPKKVLENHGLFMLDTFNIGDVRISPSNDIAWLRIGNGFIADQNRVTMKEIEDKDVPEQTIEESVKPIVTNGDKLALLKKLTPKPNITAPKIIKDDKFFKELTESDHFKQLQNAVHGVSDLNDQVEIEELSGDTDTINRAIAIANELSESEEASDEAGTPESNVDPSTDMSEVFAAAGQPEDSITIPSEKLEETIDDLLTKDANAEHLPDRYTINPPVEQNELQTLPTSVFGPLAKRLKVQQLNPMQTLVYNSGCIERKENTIISSQTASGKTLVGVFGIDKCLDSGNIAIYVSPMKALTEEKFEEFKAIWPEAKIMILTGDYELSERQKQELPSCDIIVMTVEMLSSRCTKRYLESNDWLKSVGTVVIDECLPYDSKVTLSDGRKMKIGKIVEEKLDVDVLCFDVLTGEFKSSKITGFHKIPKIKKMIKIIHNNGELTCTVDHKIYVKNLGYIEAQYISSGEIILVDWCKHGEHTTTNNVRHSFKNRFRVKRGKSVNEHNSSKRMYWSVDSRGKKHNTRRTIRRHECDSTSKQKNCTDKNESYYKRREIREVAVREVKEINDRNITKNTRQHEWVGGTTTSIQHSLADTTRRHIQINSPKLKEKGSNKELVRLNNRQNSIGSMVYGRRFANARIFSNNSNSWFQLRREYPTEELVRRKMDDQIKTSRDEKRLWKLWNKTIHFFETKCRRSRQINGNDWRNNRTINGTQGIIKNRRNILSDVWSDIHSFKTRNANNKTSNYMPSRGVQKEVEKHVGKNRDGISEERSWVYDITVDKYHNFFADNVLVHNCHLISSEGRGDKLETAIMQFTSVNNCQLILLSATLAKLELLGDWLSDLNGRKTTVIKSDYRPTKLIQHIEPFNDDNGVWDFAERIRVADRIIRENPNDKYIVFCPSRKDSVKASVHFKALKLKAEFHNASLGRQERLEVEQKFKTGDLQIICATTTLAMGVNLPARRVIVLGVHRGLKEVDALEILQCMGRAGRPQFDTQGDAHVIVPSSEALYHVDRLKNITIRTVLGRIRDLSFHVLNEIFMGEIDDLTGLKAWWSRTFAAKLGQFIDASCVIPILTKLGMIKDVGGKYIVTAIGKVGPLLYQYPDDVAAWRDKFRLVVENGLFESDVAVSVALVTPSKVETADFVGRDEKIAVEDFYKKNMAVFQSMRTQDLVEVKHAMNFYECLTGAEDGVARELINMDIERTIESLKYIDGIQGWSQRKEFEMLGLRINYGVPKDAIEIVQIPGIGRARALKLIKEEFKTRYDILENQDDFKAIIGDKVGQGIIDNLERNINVTKGLNRRMNRTPATRMSSWRN